jgi:aryl-alcohol dehydrogenase-like predicted oxidoreductase
MDTVKLGRTVIKVSPLCLGTMSFPYRIPENEGNEIKNKAIDPETNCLGSAYFTVSCEVVKNARTLQSQTRG